ncbi:MAG: NUDIX domain-containing protein [Mycobacterium leprae]
MDLEAQVVTAGAYVICGDGRIPFGIGPTLRGDRLAVFRVGGHREPGENSLDCAFREVYEESSLRAEPVAPPAIYWSRQQGATNRWRLETGTWPRKPSPVLIVERSAGALSVMYLAQSSGTPEPANEVHGLLLLTPADVMQLVYHRPTLRQFLTDGGRAMLRTTLDQDIPLQPFPQLRILAVLLQLHPDLCSTRSTQSRL